MQETYRTGGTGIGTILLIVFIVLKVTNLITWSWIWVLSPLWIPILAIILVAIFYAIILTLK